MPRGKPTIPIRRRLAPHLTPSLDRSRTVTISFDGQPIQAYAGDTVASAVYGAGIHLFSRSFKYHRPRGLLCCSGRCPNCLVTIDGTPNVRACMTAVAEGQQVQPQNAFPTLQNDMMSVVDKVDRLLPVGFYYKTFIYPRAAWPLYETVLRNIAGLGSVDFTKDATTHYVRRYLHADVVVVGGGAAGLAAALAAALAGLRVALVDDNPALGGHLRGDTHVYAEAGDASGQTGHAIITGLIQRLSECSNVEVLINALAFGLYEGNLLAVAQGQTLIEVRAARVVVATGSFEHPLVFHNNDLPGVMLGSAATRLVRLWGVKPAARALVVSAHDEGLRVAVDLLDAGITIAAVAEHRTDLPDSPELRCLVEARVPLFKGWSIVEATGQGQVDGAVLMQLDDEGLPIAGTEFRGRCSLVVLSTGLETNTALLSQGGCTVTYDESLDLFTPRALAPGISVAGDVTGVRDIQAALLGGEIAGIEAALSMHDDAATRASLPAKQAQLGALEEAYRARTTARAIPPSPSGRKNFICPCEDVTLKDIDWAVQEGFDNVETLKRYSTVSMGPCQGKMCSINAAAACARATKRTLAQTGTTTARPLVSPVALGVLAGPHLHPTRRTAMHHCHVALGAEMMDAGQWLRPRLYTSAAEECLAVRERAGIIDVSTLGKIDLKGRDAVALLERIYTNKLADLKVGRVRYGLMVDETGIILDDGTIARLADDHFFITTTSSGVGAVEEWLTWGMEGANLCAHVTNVTAGLAAINLAGPRSRDILAKLTNLDISAADLPYLHAVQGDVAGIPAIILRIGFVGELGYEMHVPAEYGEDFWNILMEAGQEFGIAPFGVEAQRILRLEKGHIIVTQDTDALSTPIEAAMSWTVKLDKPDFIGKTSLAYLASGTLNQKLAGFEMLDAATVPAEGAQIIRDDGYPVGRVTSARFSPTLRKAIGLAWVPVTDAAVGTQILIQIDGHASTARIVPVPFYDAPGTRMKS